MEGRSRLAWIQHNRSRPRRTHPVAALMQEFASGITTDDNLERLAARLSTGVDADFRRHARLGEIRGSTLVIHIDHPTRLAAFEVQWLRRLGELLRGYSEGARVRKIAFALGQSGTTIPAPSAFDTGGSTDPTGQ